MNFINNMLGGGGGRVPGGYGGGGYHMPQQKAQYQDFLNVLHSYNAGAAILEDTASVLLPPEVLNTISHFQFPIPMLFCITNTYNNKSFYAGVKEFTAPPKTCVLPFWMFNELQCFEGQQVAVSLIVDYKKGRLIKIQPHETAFIDLPNPKAILEHELPLQFQFLTKGQTIQINHMKQKYKLNILEVKPEDNYNTICIVDTDLNIDFAPPLDYIEEAKPLPPLTKKTSSQKEREKEEEKEIRAFKGNCVRIDEKPIDKKKLQMQEQKLKEEKEYDPRKFKLKHGIRKNLDSHIFSGSSVKIGATKQY